MRQGLLFGAQDKELADAERRRRTSARLPLVGEGWTKGIDKSESLVRDSGCTRCALHTSAQTVCMPALRMSEAPTGGVLLVAPSPTMSDDAMGELLLSGLTGQVLAEVGKHYTGPIRLTHAVACATGRLDAPGLEKAVTSCRPYLAAEVASMRPDRIVCLGDVAVRSVFGHRLNPQDTRRGWGMVMGLPAFAVMNPQSGVHNRFTDRWWRQDLKWALTTPVPEIEEGWVRVLLDPADVRDYLAALDPKETTAVDCEWRGDTWFPDFELLCVGLCQDPRAPVVIPADVAMAAQADLVEWFEDAAKAKVGHFLKEDRHVIHRALGADMRGVKVDTMSWSKQRDSDSPAGLKSLAWVVGWGGYAGDVVATAEDEREGGKRDYGRLAPDQLHQYNGRDTSVTKRVEAYLAPKMSRYLPTWERLVRPAMHALGHVERWGAKLDADSVRTYDRWLKQRLDRLGEVLRSHDIPATFNPASPQQVAALLYGKLGLPATRRTATGAPSTDAEALETLKDAHPIVPVLQEHASYRAQLKNYGVKLLDTIGYDGRVHTTYRIVRSGRLSSKTPNLQQITAPDVKPGDKDYETRAPDDQGIWARGCWVADPGELLVEADYALMELRVAAMLSGDEEMAAAFEAGYDFHRMTAADVFGISPDQVDAGQRRTAKSVNFALAFGKEAFGLGMDLHITTERAQEIIDSILAKYKKYAAWRQGRIAEAERTGESFVRWAPEGTGVDWVHRRDIWQMGERGKDKVAGKAIRHARNVALNNPIQNMANAFSLASLADVVQWILDDDVPARVLITVHDALILGVRADLAHEVAHEVARRMTQWPSGCVKLKADLSIGPDWGHMSSLKD